VDVLRHQARFLVGCAPLDDNSYWHRRS
jgi:hypothetical protein